LKKQIITIAVILFFSVFSAISFAESIEVAGVVKAISGEKIVITNEEGNESSFVVNEDTGLSEGIKAGSKVSIEAEEGKAVYVDLAEE